MEKYHKKPNLNKSDAFTSFSPALENVVVRFMDFLFASWPRKLPAKMKLKQCKIVSHRGIFNNQRVLENTLEAFEQVKNYGIWGVELDIRWTRDLVPMVFHDNNLARLFGISDKLSRENFSDIKNRFPVIPSLEEVVKRFGKDLHLMVEMKKEVYPDPEYQNRVFKDVFMELQPKQDYHLLSLDPEMLDLITFVSMEACLPIVTKNVGACSRLAFTKGYGGINGHYLLVGNAMLLRHHQKKQKVGTGFVESVNCLFRELNRGVDWVFSNNAAKLQSQINAML